MARRPKNRPLLGLDVGSNSVKLVEVQRTRAGLEASVADLRPLSPEVVVDGAIVDNLALSSTVSQMLKDNRSKNRAVATAVSGHSVIVKQISMSAMTEEELADTMTVEAAQHVPFELSDVNLDYQILDLKENGTMDVLLVAVKKDKIANYGNALSMAGLTPAIVDHDPFALHNCYEFNYQPAPDEIAALLNVGASVTNIIVSKGDTPLFTRDVSVGGNQYTDALQKEFGLGFDEAEAAKLGGSGGPPEEKRLPVLKSVSEIILLEIQKTFDFFRTSTGGQHVGKLMLSGGAAQTAGLIDLLQSEFGVPVELLNPFRRVGYVETGTMGDVIAHNRPRLAVAVGLALRSFEDL